MTNDFSVNPYRYRPETTQGSQHLLHAIVAISCHFRLRSPSQSRPPADAINHKNRAIALYQGALAKDDIQFKGLSMLDTALALWQMEVSWFQEVLLVLSNANLIMFGQATESALNIWKSHLLNAYTLLELCGGVETWPGFMRANLQVSMLLW